MSQRLLRPITGVHAIPVAKIKTSNRTQPDRLDEVMTEIEENGLPSPLPCTWDPYDWRAGYVHFNGDATVLTALRELGHTVVDCDVKIDPESGLQADQKEILLEVKESRVENG